MKKLFAILIIFMSFFFACDETKKQIIMLPGPAGADGQDGTDGIDGTNGTDGVDGLDGANGISCVATEVPATTDPVHVAGLKINCGAGDYYVWDGADGQDGADGSDGINGVNGEPGYTLLTPCNGGLFGNLPSGPFIGNSGYSIYKLGTGATAIFILGYNSNYPSASNIIMTKGTWYPNGVTPGQYFYFGVRSSDGELQCCIRSYGDPTPCQAL